MGRSLFRGSRSFSKISGLWKIKKALLGMNPGGAFLLMFYNRPQQFGAFVEETMGSELERILQ